IKMLERTIELSPGFSRAFLLLGECLNKEGLKDKAIEVLTKGWTTADERGDRVPREAMGKLLVSLGAPIPAPAAPKAEHEGPGTGVKGPRPGGKGGEAGEPPPRPAAAGRHRRAHLPRHLRRVLDPLVEGSERQDHQREPARSEFRIPPAGIRPVHAGLH